MLKATVSYIKCSNDKILSFASTFYRENGSMKRKAMTNAKDLKLQEALCILLGKEEAKENISMAVYCVKRHYSLTIILTVLLTLIPTRDG